MIFVHQIQRATADEYRVPVETMVEPRPIGKTGANNRSISHPRQSAIYLSACLTTHSYVRIGQLFGGRDHATVINAIRAAKRRLAGNPEAQEHMRRIARAVLS